MSNKVKVKTPIKIDDLLNSVNSKKTKEFMRTDKPSRRKLYIEIYEFKDKELLNKLPVKKKDKTDGEKEAVIEFNAGTREIIQMKLKSLNRNLIELLRIKEYMSRYKIEIAEEAERLIERHNMTVRGVALPSVLSTTHERYYLITQRGGKIIGVIGMEGRTLLDSKNKVVRYGGDIITLAILRGEERKVNEVIMNLSDNEEFKKIPIWRLSYDIGDSLLMARNTPEEIRGKWVRFGRGSIQGFGWMPKDLREGLRGHGRDYLDYYYFDPPVKEFTTDVDLERWKNTFKRNFNARYEGINALKLTEEMTVEEKKKITIDWTLKRDRQCDNDMNKEYSRIETNYNRELTQWTNSVSQILSQHSEEMICMSSVGVLTGHGQHREENSDEDNDDNDGDNEGSEGDNCGESCSEFASNYCRNDCGHSPCDNCSGHTPCEECSYERNGGN